MAEPDDSTPHADIAELDDEAHQLRVTFGKMLNFFRTFIRQYIATDNQFKDGRYGWTFEEWVIKKARLNPYGGHSGFMADIAEEIDQHKLGGAKVEPIGIKTVTKAFASALTSDQVEHLFADEIALRAKLRREREEAPARKREQAREAARHRRAKQRLEKMKAAGPENPELRRLLVAERVAVQTNRIERGRLYTRMKEIVDAQEAGQNEYHKYWTWTQWAQAFIRRNRSVAQCIAAYAKSTVRRPGPVHITRPTRPGPVHITRPVA